MKHTKQFLNNLYLLGLGASLMLVISCGHEIESSPMTNLSSSMNVTPSLKDVFRVPELAIECHQTVFFGLKKRRNSSHKMEVRVNGKIQREDIDYFYSKSENSIFFDKSTFPQKNDQIEILYASAN